VTRPGATPRRLARLALAALLAAAVVVPARAASGADAATPIRIGSKKFTESYVLGEIAARLVRERAGLRVEHRAGMGGTLILWQALRAGAIDAYPEYTGTISQEILKAGGPLSAPAMRDSLARLGIGISGELGFNNTYVPTRSASAPSATCAATPGCGWASRRSSWAGATAGRRWRPAMGCASTTCAASSRAWATPRSRPAPST
jgi:hypothetical protein